MYYRNVDDGKTRWLKDREYTPTKTPNLSPHLQTLHLVSRQMTVSVAARVITNSNSVKIIAL